MDEQQKNRLSGIAPGEIQFDCGMDRFTTFRVGGKADVVCFPEEPAALGRIISFVTEEDLPWLVVGKGSNLLVRDGGFKGVIIILKGALASCDKGGLESGKLRAWAGLPITELLSLCSRFNLGGLEFLSGVPGTIGGAVAMNAGAFGEDMGTVVRKVHTLSTRGEIIRQREQLEFSYRYLAIPAEEVIVKAEFDLKKEDEGIVRGRINEHLKKRKMTQPLDMPNGGSVFKNPDDDYAGRLIEKAGLKGKKIGGAMISDVHANFIVNTGNATALDILSLIALAREGVRAKAGIELEPEIRVVGQSGT